METSIEEAEEGGQAPRHYSTGRLTLAQADLVNAWRTRLLEDRPLPGQRRVDPALGLVGIDNRPRASGSDVVAAAVAGLLRREPGELEVAQYAHAGWLAQREAAAGHREDARAPVYPPVSFYLPSDLAGPYEQLRARARERVWEMRRALETEAAERFPDDRRQRGAWLASEMDRQGIPFRMAKVPGGVLARMAIDRWARRPLDQVIAEAVAFAEEVHELQPPHRARRDMGTLRR